MLSRTTTGGGIVLLMGALLTVACSEETTASTSHASTSASVTSATVGSGGASSSSASTGGATSVGTGGASPIDYCQACSATGSLGDAAGVVNEASGLLASAVHPGVFYAHNDSGDSPRVFALSETGTLLATLAVSGASADDWEDASRGPCPSGSCLYLGDIGDNPENRSSYALYRVAEPTTLEDATLPAETFSFTYPDGSHNAETLLVHPVTGRVWIVTKSNDSPAIYRFPETLTPGGNHVLEAMGAIDPPDASLITGGDVHPSGQGVLLRTYLGIHYYAASTNDIAQALGTAPCSMPATLEVQGETVAWRPDGSGYVTLSEGAGSPMNAFACAR